MPVHLLARLLSIDLGNPQKRLSDKATEFASREKILNNATGFAHVDNVGMPYVLCFVSNSSSQKEKVT